MNSEQIYLLLLFKILIWFSISMETSQYIPKSSNLQRLLIYSFFITLIFIQKKRMTILVITVARKNMDFMAEF